MLYYDKKNVPLARQLRKNMTPWENKLWYQFLRTFTPRFQRQKPIGGYIADFYCAKTRLVIELDSAEQTLIAGIRSSLRKNGLGWIRVENALKTEINDRINATSILMAQGRFAYMDGECDSLVTALCTAVWDPKELTKNVRLDDGTSDIDSLDSFEYTFERLISQLIRYG